MVLLAGAVGAVASPSCASVALMRVPVSNGAIRLSLPRHPGLGQPDGYLKLQPATHPAPVYVLALDDGYVALSPICTHLGCTVEIESAALVCPCHGSAYDRNGEVLRGPAERPLRAYPTTLAEDGELVIQLDRGTG